MYIYIYIYIEVTFYYFEYILILVLNIDIAKKALIITQLTQGLVHASVCIVYYSFLFPYYQSQFHLLYYAKWQ